MSLNWDGNPKAVRHTKFKVGDLVKIIPIDFGGALATVINVESRVSTNVILDYFDVEINDADAKGFSKMPFRFAENELELVKMVPEKEKSPLPVDAKEKSLLPSDAKERKSVPIATGVLDYFPAALAEVAKISHVGNQQHNPGQDLHWARGKSTDQADTMIRHFLERGTFDTDGQRHSAKMAWRALAILQLELEAEGAPVARGAK